MNLQKQSAGEWNVNNAEHMCLTSVSPSSIG